MNIHDGSNIGDGLLFGYRPGNGHGNGFHYFTGLGIEGHLKGSGDDGFIYGNGYYAFSDHYGNGYGDGFDLYPVELVLK